ncbi:MAG: 4Fe-4S binding protein [Dehalococcoidales bacterium]|nr:4Fe-4S binding protein [Dehalococcoidales bacterium]
MKFINAIKRHPWRYLAIISGFLLFVYPSALFIRAFFLMQGSTAMPDLHKTCFRMPFDWIASGNFANFDGRLLTIVFLGGVLSTAFFFGPLFCGWLCPVGSSTEMLSKTMPGKFKINLVKKINPAALRYGFLGSFILVSALTVAAPSLGLASICCRYCASSQLQNLVNGIFNPAVLSYWHSGGIMVIGGWLLIGGVFWQGGRGWCLYGCPLGAVSNGLHTIGAKLGFTYKVKHDSTKCTACGKCESVCPSWSINRQEKDVSINRSTCTACLECVKACDKDCYSYKRG